MLEKDGGPVLPARRSLRKFNLHPCEPSKTNWRLNLPKSVVEQILLQFVSSVQSSEYSPLGGTEWTGQTVVTAYLVRIRE